MPHQQIVDAHFAAHDEEVEREIAQHVMHSSPSPPSAAAVSVSQARLRAPSPAPAHREHPRNAILKEISNTYQKLLEDNRKQGEELLELQKTLGAETLRLQRIGLAEIKKATEAVQWFIGQQAQQIAAPASTIQSDSAR